MLVWVVFFAVGAVAALIAVVITVSTHRHHDRVHHGAVHATAATVERGLHRSATLRELLRDRVHIAGATGLALTLALVALVAVGVGALQVRTDSAIVRVDGHVAEWASEHATAASTEVLRWFTHLGSTVGVTLISVLVVVLAARRGRWHRVALFVVVAVGGAGLANHLMKLAVERERPDLGLLANPSSFSYPSGHSSGAAVCFAAAALCLGRGRDRSTQMILIAVAAALAAMVAASRVLLGVHWLSDVLAGLALGGAWFALCAVAFGGRLLRFGAPLELAARGEQLAVGPGGIEPPTEGL